MEQIIFWFGQVFMVCAVFFAGYQRGRNVQAKVGTPFASHNSVSPKLPDESTLESFAKDTFVYKKVTHVPSFRAGARAYHEFVVRQLRA